MKILPFLLLLIGSYFVGLIAFGQILILLFRAIPKALKLKKTNKIPMMVIPIIIWIIVLYFLYPYIINKYVNYSSVIHIGLFIAFLQMFVKTIRGGKDVDSDLKDSYKL